MRIINDSGSWFARLKRSCERSPLLRTNLGVWSCHGRNSLSRATIDLETDTNVKILVVFKISTSQTELFAIAQR